MFPALFKMHKTQSVHSSQTTKTYRMYRNVENNLPLIAAFCSSACTTLCVAVVGFFQYFPIEVSGQCLEKDYHGRSLFCYSNLSINSSLPMDCAEYNVIELRELHFQCYAISVFDVGIAMATAFAIAKVVIASVTAYVKVTESFIRVTKKPPQELKRWCSWCSLRMQHWCLLDCKECADIFCLTSSMVMLFILMAISFPAAVGIGINAAIRGEKALRIVYVLCDQRTHAPSTNLWACYSTYSRTSNPP